MNQNNARKTPAILSEQSELFDYELDPLTRKCCLTLASRNDRDNRADVDTLRQMLSKEMGRPVEIPLSLMSGIHRVWQGDDGPVTATLAANPFFDDHGRVQMWRLIDLEPGDRTNVHVGLAIDIGTTTVVVYLVDMSSGRILDRASAYNRQIEQGEDILSRIMTARDAEGLALLHTLILSTLNDLIRELCTRSSLQPHAIHAASIGANTTMVHLLLGLDPSSLCKAPYIPVVNHPDLIPAQEIGLSIHPLAPIYCLPSVGSYVGGDIIAGILVSGMHRHDTLALFVDIGTNGEIVLGNKEWLVACAGAAGPALEGGVTEWGMRAEAGAIDHVEIDSNQTVHYTTIHNAPARGLCGSGLIDCLAELFLHGFIDRSAHFYDGRKHFVLVPARESSVDQDIFIGQRDIDSLMRTKGAVNAALDVLIETVGCGWEEIGTFYAAGAFGQYLPIESAVTVGLYPDLPRDRIIRLGNSSGEGARHTLLSNAKRLEAEQIAAKITYFELNANTAFMDKFKGSLFLPHTNLDFFPSVKEKLALYPRLNLSHHNSAASDTDSEH